MNPSYLLRQFFSFLSKIISSVVSKINIDCIYKENTLPVLYSQSLQFATNKKMDFESQCLNVHAVLYFLVIWVSKKRHKTQISISERSSGWAINYLACSYWGEFSLGGLQVRSWRPTNLCRNQKQLKRLCNAYCCSRQSKIKAGN